jgi:hypothetical protein
MMSPHCKIIKPDNTFAVKVDNEVVLEGNLGAADQFSPPLEPPKKVDDASDSKPDTWTDEQMMADPEDIKYGC